MQNSTIVLLINDDARAIRAEYEDGGKKSLFKTLDPTIKVDDLIVVETNTRHGMTVVKVTEVDVDINFDTDHDVKWVIQPVDADIFEQILEQEKDAIAAVQSAERRRKKEALRDALFADHQDKLKSLELSKLEGDQVTE
jgi:hypothetical protein